MNARKREANQILKLASQLKVDLATSIKLAQQVQEFAQKMPSMSPDSHNPYLYAVALSLQHLYTSLETLFKRIVKDIDGQVPEGENWHKELLETGALEIEGVRPAIFSKNILGQLDRLRKFRHIVRHGYEYELDYQQIEPIVQSIDVWFPQLKKDLASFINFLQESARLMEREK